MLTVKQIHEALNKGIAVYWGNTGYKVSQVKPSKHIEFQTSHFTRIGDYILDIRHDNGFGGLMSESEVSSCFTEGYNIR